MPTAACLFEVVQSNALAPLTQRFYACAKFMTGGHVLAVIVPFESPQGASLERLAELVASDMERVNAAILARTGSDVTMIPEVANHLISSGGKRLRPMLTLAMAETRGLLRRRPYQARRRGRVHAHGDAAARRRGRRERHAPRQARRPHAVGQRGERPGRRLPARPGVQDDGRGRQSACARYSVVGRGRDRRGRGDAARRRQEHRHQRGRISGGDPRQDRRTVRRRLRSRPGAGRRKTRPSSPPAVRSA